MSRRHHRLATALAAIILAAVIPATATASAPATVAGGAFSALAMTAAVAPDSVAITITQTRPTTADALYVITLPDNGMGGVTDAVCTLDGAVIPCNVQQPLQLTGLSLGRHMFAVSGTDYYNDGAAISGSVTWTQKAVAPALSRPGFRGDCVDWFPTLIVRASSAT